MTPEQYISIRNRIDAQTEAIVFAIYYTATEDVTTARMMAQEAMSDYYEKVKVP